MIVFSFAPIDVATSTPVRRPPTFHLCEVFSGHPVRRRTLKINETMSIIEDIKEKKLLQPTVADQISENFSNLGKEIIMNHFQNEDRKERLSFVRSFVDHQCKMPNKFSG